MAERAPSRDLVRVIGGWIAFIALETLIQVVFKLAGATLDASHGLQALLATALTTPLVLLGLGLYFCGFLAWMMLLKDFDLGRAFPMTGLIYVATFGAAIGLFHERPNTARVLGVLVIMAGVVLLSSDENSRPPEGGPLGH